LSWLSDDTVARLQNAAAQPDFSDTRYEITRALARGGMGVVYEGVDRDLRRSVAIKVLPIEFAGGDAAVRLRREAELIAGLEHPGIVPLHDMGVLADGRAFYVMKLVRGKTLAEMMQSPHTIAEALRLCIRICEPVAFAHARGVVHSDLKPANVMIGEFGEVLVMDWGVSVAGTPGYMAPEQESASRGPVTDVFALGVILRQILARSGESLPRRLRAILTKATASSPGDRYSSARLLADDLLRFLDGQPVTAYPETILDALLRWGNRNRALIGIVSAYLVMRMVVLLMAHR